MAFLENIRSTVKKWLFPDFSHNDFAALYGANKSNISVNENTALTFSTVFACVRVIAETIATLPLFVYKVKNGNRIKAYEHNLYNLLHNAPNEECTSVSFIESLITHILLQGNGFVEVVRDNFNAVRGLYLLDVSKMRVYRDDLGYIAYK